MSDAPPMAQTSNPSEGEPVLSLIKRIKEQRLDPVVLSAEDRRRCVEMLWGEGYSVAEIAQILKVGERTIYRDRGELRSAQALRVDAQFPAQMAGELIRQAELSTSKLRRIARESEASAMERLMAEQAAFRVQLDLITKLQSMGYLPRVPTGVVAQVVNTKGDTIASYEQLTERLQELERVDRELGEHDPQQIAQRKALAELVERGRLAAEVDSILQRPHLRN